ncbi:MAG: hypothetical protein GY716_16015 [bacterium]|nr:hypothetical protein [bacterium]
MYFSLHVNGRCHTRGEASTSSAFWNEHVPTLEGAAERLDTTRPMEVEVRDTSGSVVATSTFYHDEPLVQDDKDERCRYNEARGVTLKDMAEAVNTLGEAAKSCAGTIKDLGETVLESVDDGSFEGRRVVDGA